MYITLTQCILGLLLLLVPCYVFYVFNIPLLTKTLRSFLKMAGSLLVLGVLLYGVVALDKPFFTLLFALLIIAWGAALSVVRAKLPLRQLFLPVLAGTFAGVLVVGMYVLLLVMGGANVLEARYMIPVVAMLTGHLIHANSKALHVYYMGLRHHGQLYHYLLANGATHRRALGYLLRRAIQQSALPGLSGMGWVVMGVSPLVTWGMLLGGASVPAAVACQVVLLVAMFTAAVLSIVVTVAVSRRYLLDDYAQLKEAGRQDAD